MCVIKVSGSVDRVYVYLHTKNHLLLFPSCFHFPPLPPSLKPMSLCRLTVTEVVSLCEVWLSPFSSAASVLLQDVYKRDRPGQQQESGEQWTEEWAGEGTVTVPDTSGAWGGSSQ